MSTLVTDNFTRVDGATLGANWTKNSYSTSQFTISSNKATAAASSGTTSGYWNGAQVPTTDHWAEVVIQTNPSSNDTGPVVRSSTTAQTFYVLRINDTDVAALGSTQALELYSSAAGTFTLVGSTVNTVVAAGDTLRVEIQGTALRGYLNGVLKCSGAPSALSSGVVGIDAWSPSAGTTQFSLFNAGDFTVVAVTRKSRPFPFKPGSPRSSSSPYR